jgi:hypothetical protein
LTRYTEGNDETTALDGAQYAEDETTGEYSWSDVGMILDCRGERRFNGNLWSDHDE